MYLKKRCLELVLALASFLPSSTYAQSQEIKFGNNNLGEVQEIEQINSRMNKLIDSVKINSAFQNIPKETSLDSFVKNTGSLSKYEKVELLGRLGSLAGQRLYDSDDSLKNANEEFVFQGIANSLRTGKDFEVGVCRQIHNFITQTARKWSLPAVSFSNYYRQGGHVSSAVKIDDKWMIVNYGEVFQSKDSNLFAALDNFQRIDGVTNFRQDFYVGKRLSFTRTTPDGETFYEFNLSNPTNSALHNHVIRRKNIIGDSSLKISNLEKSLLIKKNIYFIKLGAIEGYNSALRTSPIIKMGINIEEREEYSDFVFEGDFTLAKFNQEKLNSNVAIFNMILENRMNLSDTHLGRLDLLFGMDSSIKLNNRNEAPDMGFSRIEYGFRIGEKENFAYLLSSANLGIVDLIDSKEFSFLKEQHIGFKRELFNGFEINPDLNIKPEETKYSLSLDLKKIIGEYKLDFFSGAFYSKSEFEHINPDKKGFDSGLQISKNNKGIQINYSSERQDWKQSRDKKESFEVGIF
ncbi:MAG: hypothetical protein AABX39_01580, partial [Nanoarchaeota archaeon]